MTANAKYQIPLVCHGHSRPIVQVSYSQPTPDGVFLISASKDGKPMLRSGDTGDWIGTFDGHNGAVWSADLNRPALLAVTGSADFYANVWDACSGDLKHKFEHKHIVRSVAFAELAHNVFATGCQDKMVRLYDVNVPDAEPRTISNLPSSIRCLQFVQGDNLLLAACSDHRGIYVFDVRTGQRATVLETGDACTSIELTNANQLVTAEAGCVLVWDVQRLAVTKKLKPDGFEVESASLCPEKGLMVMGGSDMWLHVVDVNSGEEVDVCKGHHGPIHTVQFRPGGSTFASGSEDGTIRIWSA